MNYKKFDVYFKDESGLLNLLDYCQEYFERIDYYSNLFRDNIINNPEECKRALTELTGIYMFLKPIHEEAVSQKKNREEKYYQSKKIEIEKSGDKFVSAPIEHEASSAVASYRRVRNLLGGYVEACEQAISTCQSLLKYFAEEIKLTEK